MKWTTANFINPNYVEKHEIFVGTHTGSFKRIAVNQEKPFIQQNLQNLSSLDENSKVTSLDFGNNEKSEILIGRANKFAQVYCSKTLSVCSTVELLDTPIVGLARYETHLIAGFGTGKIQKLKDPEPLIISTGDNMSKMRQCPVDRKLIATGGKGRQNNLKIFDMENEKQVFSSKNLPHDFLQLEVPICDSDIGFIDASILATCSRYGYVRLYDIRKQRRPVQVYANENQMNFTTLIAHGNYIYTGTTMGALKAFDTRSMKTSVHTYKGFTGSISDLYLDESKKFLLSGSLDRYVRVHHTDSTDLLYQCYVKSKATQVLFKNAETVKKVDKEDDDDCILVGEEETSDDEYDELFEKMPTVGDDDEEENEKLPVKRKLKEKSTKPKKKKL